jgi:hypothetical protein
MTIAYFTIKIWHSLHFSNNFSYFESCTCRIPFQNFKRVNNKQICQSTNTFSSREGCECTWSYSNLTTCTLRLGRTNDWRGNITYKTLTRFTNVTCESRRTAEEYSTDLSLGQKRSVRTSQQNTNKSTTQVTRSDGRLNGPRSLVDLVPWCAPSNCNRLHQFNYAV